MATIPTDMGFELTNTEPLDPRLVREDIAARDALVTNLQAYEGMEVYVKSEKKKYKYNGTTWEEIGSGTGTSYDDSEVRGLINTNKTNITELTTKIGNETMDTTATDVTGAIKEVNGNLLDNVSFSADYKNIVLNRKNGTNPYTIPISAIINNAKLIELGDVDVTDIGNEKTLVYDATTQKHKYIDSTGTDELVKMDSTGDAHYLADLLDKQTIINDNGTLKVKKLDGQEVTITEINYLKGLTMNVMDLVSAFANGGVKVLNTPLNTASELDTMDRTSFIDGISYIVYVLADENHSGAKTTYLVDKTSSTFFGNADSQRNFTTNPIDLANEVTGKLGTSNIDVDSLWTLLTINDTYKTLTTNNEVFGTHGAKAMYDELTTAIGEKANTSDMPTKVSELENDSNFVGLNDTQASDTTTYSSNKIADLIAEATMGKDLGNLLIVESSADMSSLATKDNLGKSALYIGNSTNIYAKGEIYELYWDAININYISFAYSPIIKFNFTKIQEILGTRTSLTVTGEYGYQNQKYWRITTDIGMAGGSLSNYGIIPIQDKFAFGDKFKYTYDNSKKNIYRWLPTGNVPTWNLTKAWYNIDRFIMYNGIDGIYKKGRVYRLTGDKVTVSTNSTEISNLAIDKNKFLNNCSLRGNITFKWMNSEGYFALSTNGGGDAKTYTKKQFNSWGITYDGDITIGNNYIKIVTSKDTSINNWEWKDVTDKVPTKTSELTNDSNYVKSSDLSTVATSGSYNDLTDKPTIATMPPGAVISFAGSTAPVGYLLCDGSAVSRTDYPNLFAAIGTTYGEGDGSTTFNLPNLKDKFIQGSGTNAVGTEMSAGLPNIWGEFGYIKSLNSGNYYQAVNVSNGCFKSSRSITTNPASAMATKFEESDTKSGTGVIVLNATNSSSIYGNSDTVQPPAVVMNYIIKY